jgi:hypothetical protein
MTWLTPRRMRAATAALFVAATLVSSVGLSGSTKPPPRTATHHVGAPAP